MSDHKAVHSVQAKAEGKTLVMERSFEAPRELVFKAFSGSVHLESWWGPKGWQTANSRFEFQPDGVWLYCMLLPRQISSFLHLSTLRPFPEYSELESPFRIV